MISFEALRTILIMSVTGSAIGLILFIIKPFIRNRLPKTTQYYLWVLALAVLALPTSRLVVLPDASPNMPNISKTVDRYVVDNQVISERIARYEAVTEDGFIGIPESSMAEVEALVPNPWIPAAVDWFRHFHYLGAILYLGFALYSYIAFTSRIIRRNTEAAVDENAMLAELCGDRRLPILCRNPLAATPMLIGVFRPAIILPDKEYTDAQLRSVLLHELTHLRRKDVLVKWLSLLVNAVHWFNPIVWLVRREIDRACELSCDEAVIRNLDAGGKQTYGETLIYVAADFKTPHAVLSTTMCEEKKALKERLGSIMKNKKHTRLAIILSAVLILAVGGTALALGAGRTTRPAVSDNLHIKNESAAEIYSIGVHFNNQSHGTSNADNYHIKNGVTVGFQMGEIQGCTFWVEVHDANWNLIAQGEFAKDFNANSDKPVCLYIRDDENGKTYITDFDGKSLGDLAALRTPYVGNNSAVGKILGALPPLDNMHTQRFLSLGTVSEPYTLTAYYEPLRAAVNAEYDVRNITNAPKNATLLFALIDNLGVVTFAFRDTPSGNELDQAAYKSSIEFSKDDIAKYLLENFAMNLDSFHNDWNGSVEKLYSSKPVINGEWDGATRNMTLNDVRAIAKNIGPDLTYGDLCDFIGTDVGFGLFIMNYDIEGGEYRLMVGSGSADLNTPVMYADLARVGGTLNVDEGIDIRYYDVDKYLTDGTRELVRPLPQSATSLDDAIDMAIVSHNNGKYGGGGDFSAANHATLKTVEEGNHVTVYIMAFYAEYSSENGIHETAGSHIPVAITLEKTSFRPVEYWEAKNGSYYLPSIKEKFPSDIWDKVDTQLYSRGQQENCLQKAKTHYAKPPAADYH